ncbi:MAG: RNA polymerase factor sigma-54 [Verrucomicrobia bacterium]|nr:RNA polymerase factor sigma-54 [Verrucomicrobiota bacterium]
MDLRQVPEQRMVFSQALRLALEVLQKPHQELALWLQEEVESNPLLEISETPPFKEPVDIPDKPSLYEHLLREIRDTFSNPTDLQIAEELIGHFDEKGFITTPLEEITHLFDCSKEQVEAVLLKIQALDPPGIGARSLQESLLIQLRRQKDKNSLAYRLVKEHFDDLLHGRYTSLKKKLEITPVEISQAIQKLAKLQLRPAVGFKEVPAPTAIPDLRALKMDQNWIIEVAEEEFPPIQIRKDLHEILPKLAQSEKKTVRSWLISAKWLLRSLNRRKTMLHTIALHLIRKQADFLDQRAPLQEIDVQDLAVLVGVHESTIHRALSGKIIEGPWGTIPLRSLLSQTASIDRSKMMLQRLIEQENKKSPLTDEELSEALHQQGIDMARRTVAKYRKELKLGSATQRKRLIEQSL